MAKAKELVVLFVIQLVCVQKTESIVIPVLAATSKIFGVDPLKAVIAEAKKWDRKLALLENKTKTIEETRVTEDERIYNLWKAKHLYGADGNNKTKEASSPSRQKRALPGDIQMSILLTRLGLDFERWILKQNSAFIKELFLPKAHNIPHRPDVTAKGASDRPRPRQKRGLESKSSQTDWQLSPQYDDKTARKNTMMEDLKQRAKEANGKRIVLATIGKGQTTIETIEKTADSPPGGSSQQSKPGRSPSPSPLPDTPPSSPGLTSKSSGSSPSSTADKQTNEPSISPPRKRSRSPVAMSDEEESLIKAIEEKETSRRNEKGGNRYNLRDTGNIQYPRRVTDQCFICTLCSKAEKRRQRKRCRRN